VARIELAGGPVLLVDTAGLGVDLADGPRDGIERAAAERSESALESADLVVWVVDAGASDARRPPRGVEPLLAWNKVDLPGVPPRPPDGLAGGLAWVATSAVEGTGIDELAAAIERVLAGRTADESAGHARAIAQRHRLALEEAGRVLGEAEAARRAAAPLEIQAEHLRAACAVLDAITGSTTAEDVLDRIFARFCLGK
jgi:tRNA modification GTPase